jgi:hypothetical protein
MATIVTDWLSYVLKADPEHTLNSRRVTEYEFTAAAGGRNGNPETHENGFRVFKGDYTTRGPYAD